MAQMFHDDFESWIRARAEGCCDEKELARLVAADLDFDSGEYTFRDQSVQMQWEAWKAALESQGFSNSPTGIR